MCFVASIAFAPATPARSFDSLASFDPTDVPFVTASAMIRALLAGIGSNPVPHLGSGLDEDVIERIEAALWRTRAPCSERTAVMVRLRALADVLTARRFAPLLARHGERLTGPALAAAARLRLNAHAGFNPVQMMWALEAALKVANFETSTTVAGNDAIALQLAA